MRMTRTLAAGLALTMVLPSSRGPVVMAEGSLTPRFWGSRRAGVSYAKVSADPATVPQNYGQAPLVGVEWLITRTHGALYTSFSQAFLSQQTLIPNSADASEHHLPGGRPGKMCAPSTWR